MKKIAFLFLIYDTINHEDLWNIFFKNVDSNKYNIYIHYKNNTQLKYFERYKLNQCAETSYGNISIVYAQNVLLNAAMTDPENTHFVFLSNSCIPLKNFDYIYNNLDEKYSYFNMCDQEQCFSRCDFALQFIDRQYIQKAHQWCILNRKHTQLLLNEPDYMLWFYMVPAADEHCYITKLYHNNLQNELITTMNIADNATTFTNWPGMGYKFDSEDNIKNYKYISKEELEYLLDSKSLFGRKFNPECITSLYIPEYIQRILSVKYEINSAVVDVIEDYCRSVLLSVEKIHNCTGYDRKQILQQLQSLDIWELLHSNPTE